MASDGGGGSSKKEIALRLRAAAEEAVQSIGLGYDLTLDLRLKYCKRRQSTKEGSRLIAVDDGQVRDIAVPGGILVQNVPKSINCDKGERMRFSSDVLTFQQVFIFVLLFLFLFSELQIMLQIGKVREGAELACN